MASRKEGKSTEDSNPNTDILSYTTSRITDAIKTWKQVYAILEHKFFLCPDDSTEEEDELFSTKLRLVAKSELHKVVARLRTMPYNDMISWALDHIDIQARSIFSHQKTFVGSFRPKYIQVMYKLSSEPKYTYNSTFILDF